MSRYLLHLTARHAVAPELNVNSRWKVMREGGVVRGKSVGEPQGDILTHGQLDLVLAGPEGRTVLGLKSLRHLQDHLLFRLSSFHQEL